MAKTWSNPRNPRRKAARPSLPLRMTNSSQPDNSIAARLEEAGSQMTFFEHLTELRKRIINSLYAIGAGAFLGVYLAPGVLYFTSEPMQKALVNAGYADKLYYNLPAGAVN